MPSDIRRCDIRLVDFEPVRGSESNKRRPAVIVSNDSMNTAAERTGTGVVTVLPVTSNTTHIYDFQVLLPSNRSGLTNSSKVQAEQIRSVDIARVGKMVGFVPADLMDEVEKAIKVHLALS